MFDISFGEMILLAAIALIAIGPKQLPQVARTIGRLMREFQRATGDFTRTIIEARDSAHQSLTDTKNVMTDALTVDIDGKTKGPKLPGAPASSGPQEQGHIPAAPHAEAAAAPAAVPAAEPAVDPAGDQSSVPTMPLIRPALEARPIGASAPAEKKEV